MNNRNNKKGFTLIELLVVMGILGILMAVTILVINPAQYLARARDTQRINDIQAVNSAVAMAIANGDDLVSVTNCFASIAGTAAIACNGGSSVSPTVGDRTTAGTAGWVRGVITTGTLSALPIDPVNSTTYFYLWASSSTNYEINASKMESTYYTTTNNIAGNDGGGNSNAYEIGSSLTLIP